MFPPISYQKSDDPQKYVLKQRGTSLTNYYGASSSWWAQLHLSLYLTPLCSPPLSVSHLGRLAKHLLCCHRHRHHNHFIVFVFVLTTLSMAGDPFHLSASPLNGEENPASVNLKLLSYPSYK